MKNELKDPLQLASGNLLKNRIAKAAMSENMSDAGFVPGKRFENLYSQWARGEVGLLITGNVMIDKNHLGEPNNVVLETGFSKQKDLNAWARAGAKQGGLIYMQLNHPGKQSPKFLNPEPVAPSAIGYTSKLSRLFNPPRELREDEILEIIERFSVAAYIAKAAGFHGIQIHGAHGYLVSQFLSPLHNTRSDRWGGRLENRMRFLLQIIDAIRAKVGSQFGIAVKLNSADFQKGGFTQVEALEVIKNLDQLKLDFIEISGGSYEVPVMTGKVKDSSHRREAYFLEFAKQIRDSVQTPLMVTGGFRTVAVMREALSSGVNIIGLARPFCIYPDLAHQILTGEIQEISCDEKKSGVQFIDRTFPLEIIWYTDQLHRMGKNKKPNPNATVYPAILKMMMSMGFEGLKRVRG